MSKDMLGSVTRALVGVPHEYLGVTLDFANKLGGKDGARWKTRFAEVLREGIPSAVTNPSPSFPIWKSLTIGTGLTDANAFRIAHKRANCRIGDYADQLLGKITIAKEPIALDLVRVSVAELGFKDGAYLKDIYARAQQELGLMLCPAEVGPQLRLAYLDQPLGEWLAVAMEPVADSDGNLRVFGVEQDDGGLWLHAYWGGSSGFWSPDYRLVFVRR
jgi:hypothetical protein